MSQDNVEHPVPAVDQVSLALERTFLAYERTLMAWTRTSTSLITFGFTLYKFFEYLHERGEVARGPQLLGARAFGMVMIGVGVVTLVLATIQHRLQLRRLYATPNKPPFSLSFVLATLIAGLGILGFVSGLVQ